MADTPENLRLKQQSELQSQVMPTRPVFVTLVLNTVHKVTLWSSCHRTVPAGSLAGVEPKAGLGGHPGGDC